jgi:prepilin-type N-terminal cleavage/methylation domain-containing protein
LRLFAPEDRRRARGRAFRRGFTLVEVIVVLVILAILAAIAIPALTGYIDKAEGKRYIADARTIMIAATTMLDLQYVEKDKAPFDITATTETASDTDYFRTFANGKIPLSGMLYRGLLATSDYDTSPGLILYRELTGEDSPKITFVGRANVHRRFVIWVDKDNHIVAAVFESKPPEGSDEVIRVTWNFNECSYAFGYAHEWGVGDYGYKVWRVSLQNETVKPF